MTFLYVMFFLIYISFNSGNFSSLWGCNFPCISTSQLPLSHSLSLSVPLSYTLSPPQCVRWLWETVWNVSSTLWVSLVQRAAVDSKAFWEPASLYQHRQVQHHAKDTSFSLSTVQMVILNRFDSYSSSKKNKNKKLHSTLTAHLLFRIFPKLLH